MSVLSFFTQSMPRFLAVAALVTIPALAQADNSKGASEFVQSLGDKAISTLADKTVTPEQAGRTFRNMLQNSFDIDLIGKFALGAANWKSATPEQKQKYMKLFEKLVVQIYSDRFKLYSGESFKVLSATSEDERDTYVNSHIARPEPGAPPVQVDWRVRTKGGSHKIIDVIVEGVSMSVTQRSEFSAVIQKNGGNIAEFLDVLEQRVASVQ